MGEYVVETCWDGTWRVMHNSSDGGKPFVFSSIEEAWAEIIKHYGEAEKHLFRVRER